MPQKGANPGQRLTAAERRQRVLHLAKAGGSYRRIAELVGVSHVTVKRDLDKVLGELARDARAGAEELRALELARLDDALMAIWKQVTLGDVKAIDRFLRISERRAKLLGLDSPTRVDITGYVRQLAVAEGIDPDAAVAEAERIIREQGLDQ